MNNWMCNDELDMSLFHSDYIHLSKKGNIILSKILVSSIERHKKEEEMKKIRPTSDVSEEKTQFNEHEFPPLPRAKYHILHDEKFDGEKSYRAALLKVNKKKSLPLLSKYHCVPSVRSYSACSNDVVFVYKPNALPVSRVTPVPSSSLNVSVVKSNKCKPNKQVSVFHNCVSNTPTSYVSPVNSSNCKPSNQMSSIHHRIPNESYVSPVKCRSHSIKRHSAAPIISS